jgi:hypothetical protein
MSKGRAYTIKPQGFEESTRVPKDGCTYFGCKSENESVDIDISPEDSVLEESQKGRNFIIYYKIEKDSYWIKDLGKGFGAFVKLDSNLVKSIQVLKNNMLISLGESFIVINIKSHSPLPTLCIKRFSGKTPCETM